MGEAPTPTDWSRPTVVATGETAAGPWVLEAVPPTGDQRHLRIRHPGAAQGSNQMYGSWRVVGGWYAWWGDDRDRRRPPLLIGWAAHDIVSLTFEAAHGEVASALLFPIPSDDEAQAFVVPVDNPGNGRLIARGSEGESLGQVEMVDPIPQVVRHARMDTWRMSERGSGTFSDGTPWTVKADLRDDEIWIGLVMPDASGHPQQSNDHAHVIDGEAPSAVPNIQLSRARGVHVTVGQVTKGAARAVAHLDDGTRSTADHLAAGDLPVDLFVAAAPFPRFVVAVDVLAANGALVARTETFTPPAPFIRARERG